MRKRRQEGGAKGARKRNDSQRVCKQDSFGVDEALVRVAVEGSMRRFLEVNRNSILKSGKEKVASASYCGGMVDMITLARNALGRWAVEQLLAELEIWNRMEAPAASGISVNVAGVSAAGLSPEDAKELAGQIGKWVDERRRNNKRRVKDPMFA